jgi:hypothetical protein
MKQTLVLLLLLPSCAGDPAHSIRTGEPPGGVAWRTNRVRLTATSFVIEAAGTSYFARDLDVDVSGDPGDPSRCTLELTWHEEGVEMRFYIYFESDGVEWWSPEQRTYDGADDWITYLGEQFRTPVGEEFAGDLVLETPPGAPVAGKVAISGLRLQAFTPPVCDGSPLYLEPGYPSVETVLVENLYFRQFVWVRDAGCDEIPADGLDFVWTSNDPTIVSVIGEGIGGELTPQAVGETTVRVEAVRDGAVVATQSFPVRIEAP